MGTIKSLIESNLDVDDIVSSLVGIIEEDDDEKDRQKEIKKELKKAKKYRCKNCSKIFYSKDDCDMHELNTSHHCEEIKESELSYGIGADEKIRVNIDGVPYDLSLDDARDIYGQLEKYIKV